MKKNLGRELFRRWIMNYLATLCICIFIVAAAMGLGYFICSRRIWYYSDPLYPLINNIHHNIVYWFVAVLIVVNIFVMVHILKQIANGMQEVSDAVSHIDEDNTEEIVLPSMLSSLQQQLNEIKLHLRVSRQAEYEANKRKNDMIMYMAHDLKTPLTSVIGYLNLINDEKELSEATRQKYEGIALKKAMRLEELINEFFDITRLNFARMILETSQVNMSVMVEQMLFEFQPVFQKKGLSYTLQKDENVQVKCDVNKMERVFDNLLKNIASYSYENTEIHIVLKRYGEQGMILTTQNRGKTIPKEKQEAIFEQFFRLDSSRGTSGGGAGLGLAVTKEIVMLHGGEIKCESENENIYFIVTIPGIK